MADIFNKYGLVFDYDNFFNYPLEYSFVFFYLPTFFRSLNFSCICIYPVQGYKKCGF